MTPCACSRSVAVLCALFAGLAACAFIAEDACRDGGGRVSDTAWVCEMASGATASLWAVVPPGSAVLAALAVGVPVFLAVDAIGRRVIALRAGQA
ncbi:MAG TPA: hypothetical protein PK042_04100 [Usitatibacteraceae bacterium]|nr:hypothetical protein [Usitatibacteraceae bacterium]